MPVSHNPPVEQSEWATLPGGDLVLQGVRDLARGIESVESLLVQIGAPRLRSLGVSLPASAGGQSPEHRLYHRLGVREGAAAHSRYNALIRRLVSFERALACANR